MGRSRSRGSRRSRAASASPRSGGRRRRGGGGETAKERLQQIFTAADKDGSGKVDAAELRSALSNGTWEPFNMGTVALMIGLFDKNGDGTMSLGEFRKLWKYVEEWTSTFEKYDVDASGRISVGELHTALTAFGYRLSPDFVAGLVRQFNRQDGGSLAFDDFIEACVVLETVTGVFKDRDRSRQGAVTYQYEDFLTDSIALIFRLQYSTD